MASVYYLFDDAKDIADYIKWTTESKLDLDKKRYFAALVIQRTFRGFAIRCHYKSMVRAAIIIQKNVRGYLLRIHAAKICAEAFEKKCINSYHRLATRIQKAWRGYWVRKKFNVQTILAERKEEEETQKAIAGLFSRIFKDKELSQSEPSMTMMEDIEEGERIARKISKKTRDILQSLFEKHHLLRTYHIEGVLSVHGFQQLSLLETFLKKLDCEKYMTEVKRIYKENHKPSVEYMFEDKRARRIEDMLREKNQKERAEIVENITKKMPESIHEKPFKASKKIDRLPYIKSMIAEEKYTGYKLPVLREQTKETNDQRFKLEVHHVTSKPKEDPYFIDHWRKACCHHNLMYDFMSS